LELSLKAKNSPKNENEKMTKYSEFMKRWDIVHSDGELSYKFKVAALNMISRHLSEVWNEKLDREFCERTFIHYTEPSLIRNFYDFSIYKAFRDTDDLKTILFYFESLLDILIPHPIDWMLAKTNSKELRTWAYPAIARARAAVALQNECERILNELPINIRATSNEKGIIFYPRGADILDKELVENILERTGQYPTVTKNFVSALEKYQTKKIYERNLLDDLRLALELLLKKILKNEKSLENQKEALGKYLKEKGVPPEVGNMYQMLLGYYSQYQNNYVKHDDKVNPAEVEFMIYLTGTFMRFLLSLEETKSK
jgi:hypothetical protein